MIFRILLISLLAIFGTKAIARVENPLVFVGEIVRGGVLGSPLITDANGKVASGLIAAEISSSSASSCTTGAGTLNGMTVTPAAGTYLVIFSSDFNSPTAGLIITLQYDVGGSGLGVSQRKFMPFAGGTLTVGNQRITAGLNSIITVTGSQAITVNCVTSTGTATTASMQLDYVRLQ